jgi:hypothetical protein
MGLGMNLWVPIVVVIIIARPRWLARPHPRPFLVASVLWSHDRWNLARPSKGNGRPGFLSWGGSGPSTPTQPMSRPRLRWCARPCVARGQTDRHAQLPQAGPAPASAALSSLVAALKDSAAGRGARLPAPGQAKQSPRGQPIPGQPGPGPKRVSRIAAAHLYQRCTSCFRLVFKQGRAMAGFSRLPAWPDTSPAPDPLAA